MSNCHSSASRVSLHPDLISSFVPSVFGPTPLSRPLVGSSWLNTTACCICERALNWIIFLLWWFSSLADDERSWKSWKGWGYPLFMGPALRRELSQGSVFYSNIKRKQSNPPFVFNLSSWEANYGSYVAALTSSELHREADLQVGRNLCSRYHAKLFK